MCIVISLLSFEFQNFFKLRSSMITSLKDNYISDDISDNDAISTKWNMFFIEVKYSKLFH